MAPRSNIGLKFTVIFTVFLYSFRISNVPLTLTTDACLFFSARYRRQRWEIEATPGLGMEIVSSKINFYDFEQKNKKILFGVSKQWNKETILVWKFRNQYSTVFFLGSVLCYKINEKLFLVSKHFFLCQSLNHSSVLLTCGANRFFSVSNKKKLISLPSPFTTVYGVCSISASLFSKNVTHNLFTDHESTRIICIQCWPHSRLFQYSTTISRHLCDNYLILEILRSFAFFDETNLQPYWSNVLGNATGY